MWGFSSWTGVTPTSSLEAVPLTGTQGSPGNFFLDANVFVGDVPPETDEIISKIIHQISLLLRRSLDDTEFSVPLGASTPWSGQDILTSPESSLCPSQSARLPKQE